MNIVFYILIAILIFILLVCLSIASYAGPQVSEIYNEVNKRLSSSFTVASVFAQRVINTYLDGKISIVRKEGYLSDSYVPSQKTVFLSQDVFDSSSVAALAITAHELGHALQDKENPEILQKRHSLGLLSKMLGFFMMPLIILGVVMFFVIPENIIFGIVFLVGAMLIFLLALFVKSLTIKIEKDASKKAIMFLEELSILEPFEIKFANKLLSAALLTYIADFLRAILGWTMLTKKTNLFG